MYIGYMLKNRRQMIINDCLYKLQVHTASTKTCPRRHNINVINVKKLQYNHVLTTSCID